MVSVAIKQLVNRTLEHMPWAWEMCRQYVRYSPRPLVWEGINERVNTFYVNHQRGFTTRTAFGSLIAGDTVDIIQRYVYLYGRWEPNLTAWLTRRLRRGDVFVDVGANIGYFSLLAAQLVGTNGTVVAVEASPSIFGRLCKNIELNRVTNARLLNCAASETTGTLRLFRAPASNLGATSMYADVAFKEEAVVTAKPLYKMLTADEVARARVIKIDVEGAEAGVVKGMLPMLRAARQDVEIVVEVGGGPKGSPSAQESASAIVPMLTRYGFNVYRVANDYAPAAYARAGAPRRPERVHNIADICDECDLIFSRRDTPLL